MLWCRPHRWSGNGSDRGAGANAAAEAAAALFKVNDDDVGANAIDAAGRRRSKGSKLRTTHGSGGIILPMVLVLVLVSGVLSTVGVGRLVSVSARWREKGYVNNSFLSFLTQLNECR